MSASSSSRDSARNGAQRPSTPDQSRSSLARAGSLSVAPKSEYLRNALQAHRAQRGCPSPSPLDTRIPTSSTPKPSLANNPTTTSPDGFDEFELTDEQTRPVSPIRPRRLSDAGMPRSKTSRQLTEEIEKLKGSLMTSNMRVELLKKNNSELQHTTTKLMERVEELEPYEEENSELQEENNRLKLQVQEMHEEMERLEDDNNELQKANKDMLAINVECSSHFEDQDAAVQEAAEAIVALETEKAALAVEVQKLKERVTLLEDGSFGTSILIDGSPRAPSLVYSIDESRPSTSHFDSDYYSQPDSPQAKRSKESVIPIVPSARSKKFLELTQERRQSARDLAKRMSTASMAALRMASLSQAEDIPEVPELPFGGPKIAEHISEKRSSRASKRYRDRRLPESILQDALQISPTMSGVTGPRSKTPVHQEVRRMSRSTQSTGGLSSPDSGPLSSQARTSTAAAKFRHVQPSTPDISPSVPSRRSSIKPHTNSSNEQPRHRRSESDIGSAETPRATAEEWASESPPAVLARSSITSSSSLTSVSDTQDKDRWWRSVQPLTRQQQATSQPHPQYQSPPYLPLQGARPSDSGHQSQWSPTLTRTRSHHPEVLGQSTRIDTHGASNVPQSSVSRRTRTQPNTPAASSPYMERDFLFNSNEDADTFMRKAKARLSGRR